MSKAIPQKTEKLTLERVKKLETNRRRYEKIAGAALDTCDKLFNEKKRLERDLEFYKNNSGNENDMLVVELNRYLDSVEFAEDDDELEGNDYEIEDMSQSRCLDHQRKKPKRKTVLVQKKSHQKKI